MRGWLPRSVEKAGEKGADVDPRVLLPTITKEVSTGNVDALDNSDRLYPIGV